MIILNCFQLDFDCQLVLLEIGLIFEGLEEVREVFGDFWGFGPRDCFEVGVVVKVFDGSGNLFFVILCLDLSTQVFFCDVRSGMACS